MFGGDDSVRNSSRAYARSPHVEYVGNPCTSPRLSIRVFNLWQMLAALAYSRDTPGVWFLDPQNWVSKNLFKAASIWEIPLVKPRYTCNVAPKFLATSSDEVAGVLQDNLDFFARGGKCDSGVIDFVPRG